MMWRQELVPVGRQGSGLAFEWDPIREYFIVARLYSNKVL